MEVMMKEETVAKNSVDAAGDARGEMEASAFPDQVDSASTKEPRAIVVTQPAAVLQQSQATRDKKDAPALSKMVDSAAVNEPRALTAAQPAAVIKQPQATVVIKLEVPRVPENVCGEKLSEPIRANRSGTAHGSGLDAVRRKLSGGIPKDHAVSVLEAATEAKKITARLEKYVGVLMGEPETAIRVLLGLNIMHPEPRPENELHATFQEPLHVSPVRRLVDPSTQQPALRWSPMKSAQSQILTPFTKAECEAFNEKADAAINEVGALNANICLPMETPELVPEQIVPPLDTAKVQAQNQDVSRSVREAMQILHSDSSRRSSPRRTRFKASPRDSKKESTTNDTDAAENILPGSGLTFIKTDPNYKGAHPEYLQGHVPSSVLENVKRRHMKLKSQWRQHARGNNGRAKFYKKTRESPTKERLMYKRTGGLKPGTTPRYRKLARDTMRRSNFSRGYSDSTYDQSRRRSPLKSRVEIRASERDDGNTSKNYTDYSHRVASRYREKRGTDRGLPRSPNHRQKPELPRSTFAVKRGLPQRRARSPFRMKSPKKQKPRDGRAMPLSPRWWSQPHKHREGAKEKSWWSDSSSSDDEY